MEYIESLLRFAESLAEKARLETLKLFRQNASVEIKADASPVTVADRNSEAAMREMIAGAYPTHGVIGEEFGADTGASQLWILDPIDGTRSFISGSPMYCTLIGFVQDGKPLIGLIDMPALNERWLGINSAVESFATFNGRPCHVAANTALAGAIMATTTMGLTDDERNAALLRLSRLSAHTRLGGDAQAYGSVAGGFVNLTADYEMQAYDYLPLAPIVLAAGGQMTDWRGRPLNLESGKCETLASADKTLHEEALTVLAFS